MAEGRSSKKAAGEPETLAAIAKFPDHYRAIGERVHAIVMASAPELQPTTWYGMPAYAKNGAVICFFRADKKYMTFGLQPDANLALEADAAHLLRPSSWFFDGMDEPTEAEIARIVRKAAS